MSTDRGIKPSAYGNRILDASARLRWESLIRPDAASYVLGAILSIIVGGIALLIFGTAPFSAWKSLFQGAVGSQTAIGNSLTVAAPIALCGLAVVVPLRAGLLNIGGDGQFLVGALGCVAVAAVMPHIAVIGAIVLLLAGMVTGAAFAAVPAIGRARFGVNEVVSTILLNFVAAELLSWAVDGPLRGGSLPQTNLVPGTFLLPKVGSQLQLHIGVFVTVFVILGVAIILAKTALGYRMRIVGSSSGVTRYLGISAGRITTGSLVVAGGIAGMAGAMEILGVQGVLIDGYDPGYGFDGLAAAFLGGGRPVGTLVAALVLGGLHAGGNLLQVTTQLNISVVVVLEAILVIVTLVVRGFSARMLHQRAQLATEA